MEGINKLPDTTNKNLHNIINNKVNEFKREILEKQYITEFSSNNTALNPVINEETNCFTCYKEVESLFKGLANKTSASFDKIPNIVLKNSTKRIIRNYTILFNNMLNQGYFPDKWKVAKVITLIKKRDQPTEPDNLRPISLLPVISKIYERLINRSIVSFSEKNNIIPEQQFGFKKKHSTIHAINKLTSDINWHHSKKDMVGACLIDLRKAFDSVWLEALIYKLIKKKLSILPN